jgi:hypothetical protein
MSLVSGSIVEQAFPVESKPHVVPLRIEKLRFT